VLSDCALRGGIRRALETVKSLSHALNTLSAIAEKREPTSGLEPLTCSSYECAVTYTAVCRPVRKRRINKPNLRFYRERQFAVYRRISPTLSSKLSSR
jgi:hypothetical protein